MSLKHLLGLDNCSLTEEEIIQSLKDASSKKLEEIEFADNNQSIKINLCSVNPQGV
jgi:hypothetical protein